MLPNTLLITVVDIEHLIFRTYLHSPEEGFVSFDPSFALGFPGSLEADALGPTTTWEVSRDRRAWLAKVPNHLCRRGVMHWPGLLEQCWQMQLFTL